MPKIPHMSETDTESVPLSLFHTGRAQCPDCGAPLALVDHQPFVQCQYCGGSAVVQRRLRTVEPVISEGFITADAPIDMARKIKPSQIISAIAQDESHCPTCGIELEAATTQAIRRCSSCGTQSKIERRLLRSPDADAALDALEKEADEFERHRLDETEALIDKVCGRADLPARVRAARELGEYWSHTNVRAARLLPRVLPVLRAGDPRVEIPLAELIGKLLCSDNIVLANAVLRAAEKFVFDVNGSHSLLRALSLGSGIGLKLLLDTADYAGTRGAVKYACSALWGINTMIERNYAGRMRLAEIVLYRLLYLRGPVQAWAIELAKGQMGLGCRFPTPTLLHFIDDCAAERPELVPHIRECFYGGQASTEGDYVNRLAYLKQLHTPFAKASALEHLYAPPPDASDTAVARCLRTILALADDPHLGPPAIKYIADLIEDGSDTPRACVEAMVRTHGDKLPEEIRRAFLRKVPKTPLLTPLPVRYLNFDKPPRTPFDDQLDQWKEMWNQGIREAVDDHHERQRIAREYWESVKGS